MNELIDTIVSAIQDKKGKRILSLDLSGFDGAICSAFVVCSADSTTQVEAIAGGVEQKVLEKLGEKVWRVEGLGNSVWVVMDYGDVMVHVFQTATSTSSSSFGPTLPSANTRRSSRVHTTAPFRCVMRCG